MTFSLAAHARADEASAPLDERRGTVIPIEYRPPSVPYPIVSLRINGHAPLPFLIDTGTNNFVIQRWAVAALDLTPKTVTSKTDGSIQQIIPALKARLEDPAQKRHLDVSVSEARVLDDPALSTAVPGERLAGIVSFGFLGWSVFRLDFAANTLTVFPPVAQPVSIPGATSIPFELTSDALPAITFTAGGKDSVGMILDTGGLGTQIPVTVAKSLGSAHQTDYAFTERESSLYITPQIRVDDFALGAMHIMNVDAVVLPDHVSSSLGLNVLSHYRLTVDAPRHELFLEPASGTEISQAPSGIELSEDHSGWSVSRVDASSPAAKAGLRPGDTILAVDGHGIENASKHAVQALLYGPAGTAAQVTVQRVSGAVQNIAFVRAPFTPTVLSPLSGLMLTVIQSGPVTVLDAPASSPAYRAGLRIGDKITVIGGKPVAGMDFGQLADAVDSPKLTFAVARKGVAGPITVVIEETVLKP